MGSWHSRAPALCAGLLSLLGSNVSRANPPAPPNRIAYAGDLIGVAGDVVVLGGTGDLLRGRDIQGFAARDGRPLRRSARLARAFLAQPPRRLLTLGNWLLGETPRSDGGVTFFDLRADAIRLQLSAQALAHRRSFPPVALGLPAAVGREQDGTVVVVVVASSRSRCAVTIEAREIKSGSVRWRWSPPGPCWAVTAATGGGRVFIHAGPSIHAVSLATGKSLWQMPSGCSDAPECLTALATDGRHVGLAIGHKTLTIFAANTGAVMSQVPCDVFNPAVTVADGRACVGGTSLGLAAETTVTCVNANGRHSWTAKVAGALRNLELEGETLYVAAGGGVRAYDAASGGIRWLFGGDRVALAHLADGFRVVLGTDGMGALVLAEGAAPGAPRELTVTGVVSVSPDYAGAAPPPRRALTIQVAGTSVHPDSGGRYRAVLKLSGGRLAIIACGCRICTAPSYIAVDERSTYEKDLAFNDSCSD